MADVETLEGTILSKTVETSVSEDGTTVITEETTVVEINDDHKDVDSKAEITEVLNKNDDSELISGENGQIAKEEVLTENNQNATESSAEVEAAPEAVVPEVNEDEKPPKVIVHQYPPGKNVPSLSIFCLKLETYLRLNKIPYENQYGYKMGKKGKMPWIEYKGERKSDSNLIIDFLNEKFEINLDSDFSDTDKALGRAIKVMLEENTYWALNYNRYVDNFNEYKKFVAPPSGGGIGFNVGIKMTQRKVRSNLEAHGIGRHSREEIYHIAEQDIKAVSELLGHKEYLLGDKPSSYDCTVFGFFANVIWCGLESPLASYISENAKDLIRHCERMKELCWQDWSEMVLGEKAEPTLKKGFSFRKKKAKVVKPKQKESEKSDEEKPEEVAFEEANDSEEVAENKGTENGVEKKDAQNDVKPSEESTAKTEE